MWKRLLCTAILAHASVGVCAAGGTPDAYPSKAIRFIAGYPPGGSADYLARLIGPKLAERLGQAVIVDNRPGAAGNLAAVIAARAGPDGYTLLVGESSLASGPSLYPKLEYDLLQDFSYISRVATVANVLVAHPSIPARSVSELVTLARSKPKALRYASAGVASPSHLYMEMLQGLARTELVHVPYKGGVPAITAVVGEEAHITFASITSAMPLIKAKRLNALAVSSAKRAAALPEVPTIAESGFPTFDATNTVGILAPAGTPAAVIKLLNAELQDIVQMDDVKAKLAAQGFEATGSTPDEWRNIIKADIVKWTRVVRDAKITAN